MSIYNIEALLCLPKIQGNKKQAFLPSPNFRGQQNESFLSYIKHRCFFYQASNVSYFNAYN